MSDLHRTVKDITTAVFHAGVNQGNRTMQIDPMYTDLQILSPEEGAFRIERIVAREKATLLGAVINSTPEEINARKSEYETKANERYKR